MKIGILGGSFDPIHNGHLHMAKSAYEQYGLDEVWLIPNGQAPHKDANNMTNGTHRMAMCELVAATYPFLKTCDIEVASREYSYTYLTMQKLKDRYPECDFYFIMGADSLDYFEKWKNPQMIAALCKILVVNRGEFTVEDLQNKIARLNHLFPVDVQLVNCSKYPVSSTEIRAGKQFCDVLPQVLEYMKENHLYGL